MFEDGFIKMRQDKNREVPDNEEIENTLTQNGFEKIASIFSKQKIDQNDFVEIAQQDFWLSILEDISRQTDEEITPKDVRAHLITKLFNIPQGWTSGLSTKKEIGVDGKIEQKRLHPELDKLIATYFTNNTAILTQINDEEPVVSTDFRDFPGIDDALELFKKEIEQLDSGKEIGMKIYTILKKERTHLHNIYKKNTNVFNTITNRPQVRDRTVEFAYLPGGVPVFLRGYIHTKQWQSIHGKHLANTYKDVDYVAIEGFSNCEIGDSLVCQWMDAKSQDGAYDKLMRDLVASGFNGLFCEIDARNTSKINFDSYPDMGDEWHEIELPDIFYEHYFLYLKREDPRFIKKVNSWQKLKELMLAQVTISSTVADLQQTIYSNTKEWNASLGISDELMSTTLPTGNELGQGAFTDALAALKLHILAQNMNIGNIKKGIVVDFEGANHMAMKSFYLKFPQYAAEIVLRTIYELMANHVKNKLPKEDFAKGKNNPDNLKYIVEMLDEPRWTDLIAEISRIPMAYVENDPDKTVEIGPNQKKMKKYDKLDGGFAQDLDTDIVWALFDDKYIQSRIESTKNKQR